MVLGLRVIVFLGVIASGTTRVHAQSDAREQALTHQARGAVEKTERLRKVYKYIILGNEADLEYNTKGMEHFEKLARESVGTTRQKAEQVRDAFNDLVKANEAILKSFDEGNWAEAKKAMAGIPALESELRKNVPKLRKREWLTVDEMAGYLEVGYGYRISEPGVLPYALKFWQLDKPPVRKRSTDGTKAQ